MRRIISSLLFPLVMSLACTPGESGSDSGSSTGQDSGTTTVEDSGSHVTEADGAVMDAAEDGRDAGMDEDASTSADGATALDAAVQPDAATSEDASQPVTTDAGTVGPGDASVSRDAAVSADASNPVKDFIAEAELNRMVTVLASDDMDGRNEGTAGWTAAREYIIGEMIACGIQPAGTTGYEQPVTGATGINILGKVEGTDPVLKDRVIILSAHYDHLGNCNGDICNGADDNAAAVAIILGVGCSLAAHPPARTVLIASWDSEEPPTFCTADMGSQFYVDHPTVPLDRIDVAIALDLVGSELWPGSMHHTILGAETAQALVDAVDATPIPAGLKALRAGLHLVEETFAYGHQPWSDYDAFRNESVPVIFFSNGQNVRYHTPDDELDTLNLPKMEMEARLLLDLMNRLGQSQQSPVWQPGGADYKADVRTVKVLLTDALAPGGLIDGMGLGVGSSNLLERDLTAVTTMEAAILGGAQPSTDQIKALRRGAQHVMCLAGGTNPFYCMGF